VSPRLSHGARLLLCAGLVVLAAAPASSAAPTVTEARAERDALAAREAALTARIDREQGALAADRSRLDRARAHHAATLAAVERRLRALYASPDPSPVIEVLTGGDLGEAQARIDLLEALGRSDREMLRRHRRAAAELVLAEARVSRTADELADDRRRVRAGLAAAEDRLAAAKERERREADAPAALPGLGDGLTVAATFGAPGAGGGPGAPVRGLPAELLRDGALPGAAPRDAVSGERIDTTPVGTGPATSRAEPGVGAVGPVAGGGVLPARLPTFSAVAGWYGPGFTRARMAGGEPYDPAAFSAASRTLRLGTLLRIAYGGRAVTVRVNDRGPYVRERDLDLSQAAAAALRLPGVATVTVQILPGRPSTSPGRSPAARGEG
jgi:hypothetical protein